MADHLCDTYPDHNSAWWSRTRLRVRKAIHQMRVIACEQYVTRTMIVSITSIYQHYLRPDRDSNAGPTA